jgi:mono/diheme cytochrome c family protein
MSTIRFFILCASLASLGKAVSAGQPTKRPTDVERGEELYIRDCAACHGATGEGSGAAGLAAPALVGVAWEKKTTVPIILEGRGDMPGFSAVMDKHDARRILTWLATQ